MRRGCGTPDAWLMCLVQWGHIFPEDQIWRSPCKTLTHIVRVPHESPFFKLPINFSAVQVPPIKTPVQPAFSSKWGQMAVSSVEHQMKLSCLLGLVVWKIHIFGDISHTPHDEMLTRWKAHGTQEPPREPPMPAHLLSLLKAGMWSLRRKGDRICSTKLSSHLCPPPFCFLSLLSFEHTYITRFSDFFKSPLAVTEFTHELQGNLTLRERNLIWSQWESPGHRRKRSSEILLIILFSQRDLSLKWKILEGSSYLPSGD